MSLAREQPQEQNLPLRIAIGVGALLLAGFAIWAFLNTRPESALVERRNLVAMVPLEGEVIAPPDARAEAMAPFEAPIARVYTSVGARVNRGDVLAELSVPNAQQAYQQAQARVQAAETAYQNAAKQYDATIDTTRKRLQAAQKTEGTMQSPPPAPAVQDNGTVRVETAPSAPSPEQTTATTERLAAEQELAQAQAQKEATLVPFRQQLEAARLSFNEAQSGRKMGMIHAPISGTVLTLNAQPGEIAGKNAQTPVAVVVNLNALQLQGPINADYATVIKPGMPVRITVKEVPNEQFSGKIQALTTQTSGTLMKRQDYVAVVRLENRRGLVKPGMNATAGIELQESRNVPAVPNEALGKDNTGRPVVRVLRNGNWQTVVVEIGVTDGRYTEIKNGLKEGETVQVKPRLL